MRKTALILIVALLAGLWAASPAGAADKLKVLLVDGQNNHKWQETTPVLKAILEGSGRFVVTVATTPPKGKPMDSFAPDWSAYDVVFSNYNGAEWPDKTKAAFEKYIAGGGGLVVVHAADNAFPRWKAFNEMIAVGGWGGRNEKSGPYLYWEKGKIVRDTSKGRGGTHGPQTPYAVVTRVPDHPITAGLPTTWLHCKDELYSRLRGPAKNVTVLATSYADPKYRGTGHNEPILMTIRYGKGRIFHTVLGHGAQQMRCVGFIVTTLRGTEWAATGQVTLTDVPPDFPKPDKVSVRTGPLNKAPMPTPAPDPSEPCRKLVTYRFGDDTAPLYAIMAMAREATPAEAKAIEAALLRAVADPKATFECKQAACRVLRRIGTPACVGALAKLLADDKLAHMARFALQRLPGKEALQAMLAALPASKGPLRIGLVSSLGERGDREAVAALANLLAEQDEALRRAVLSSLGRLGGADAAAALKAASVPAALAATRDDALLQCADSLLAEGQAARAGGIYRSMIAPGKSKWTRIAAYRGLALTEKDKAVGELLALLKSDDIDLQRAGGKFLVELPGQAATRALAAQLPSLGADAQVLVISALAERGDTSAGAGVAKLLDSSNTDVAVAAADALAVLGDASVVAPLAAKTTAAAPLGGAATAALQRIRGEGVAEALVAAMKAASADVQSKLIDILTARREAAATEALFAVATGSDAKLARSAVKALGALGGEKDLPRLLALLTQGGRASMQRELERALSQIAGRAEDPDAVAAAVIGALPAARGEAKAVLLSVLPKVATPKALAAVREQLQSSDADTQLAAVRALSAWPNSAPLGDLKKVAAPGGSSTLRVLALRGYIALATSAPDLRSAEVTKLLADAAALATRPQEKKAVLAALPKRPCKEAIALAEKLAKDPALAAEANLAAKKIRHALANVGLKLSASHGQRELRLAIDKNPGTRWTTGTPMTPGMWLAIDLGVEQTVKSVTLDTRQSSGDYPRGYEVYTSFDGTNWGKPVLTGKGTGPVTVLKFARPVITRHIKIVQTGRAAGLFWSVHELKVETE